MAKQAKRRRGRPSIAPELRRRNNVTMRLRDQTKEKLESDASINGRSLSEEIEARIEWSFQGQDLLPGLVALAYGESAAALFLTVMRAMYEAGVYSLRQSEPLDWPTSPSAYDQASSAASVVIEAFRPAGDPTLPAVTIDPDTVTKLTGFGVPKHVLDSLRHTSDPEFGAGVAERVLNALRGVAPCNADTKKWAHHVIPLLTSTPIASKK